MRFTGFTITESQEQQILFEWAKLTQSLYPELSLMFHVPNGSYRYISTAVKLKKEGVKAGVPDLFLPCARQGFHGLFIEMKTERTYLTQVQKEWVTVLKEQGYRVEVCRSFEAARDLLINYLESV